MPLVYYCGFVGYVKKVCSHKWGAEVEMTTSLCLVSTERGDRIFKSPFKLGQFGCKSGKDSKIVTSVC